MAETVTEAEIDRAMTVLRTYGVPVSVFAADYLSERVTEAELAALAVADADAERRSREILRRILAADVPGHERAGTAQ